MDRSEIVRETDSSGFDVHGSAGDGPKEAPSRGESPSFVSGFPRLSDMSDDQLVAVAIFHDVHAGDDVQVLCAYDVESDELLRVTLWCETCDVLRTYPRDIERR